MASSCAAAGATDPKAAIPTRARRAGCACPPRQSVSLSLPYHRPISRCGFYRGRADAAGSVLVGARPPPARPSRIARISNSISSRRWPLSRATAPACCRRRLWPSATPYRFPSDVIVAHGRNYRSEQTRLILSFGEAEIAVMNHEPERGSIASRNLRAQDDPLSRGPHRHCLVDRCDQPIGRKGLAR